MKSYKAAKLSREGWEAPRQVNAQGLLQEVQAAEEGLLEPDRIATVDYAAPQHGGINTNVGLIVLRRRAQDTRIFR